MQIVQVDLENVKSYRLQSVSFAEGTNAICGPNGAGKSTLLEAVGFALFDFLPYSQGQFVREGEKTATVTVHLLSKDGRIYQVVRKCGSGSQYYVYDPEVGKLTTGKEDTVAWLRDLLSVEGTENLAALFRDAVGVPQGLLTAAFLDRPANRKITFDPLLRVDEYKQIWDALLEPRRYLEGQINDQKMRMAALEAESNALPGWQGKAAALQADVETGEKHQAVLQTELATVTWQKQALEAVKVHLDTLEQALAQAHGSVETLETRLTDAEAAVERAQEAQAVVRETEAGYRAHQAAQANLEELEIRRQKRDQLDKSLGQHVTDLALARQQIETLEADLRAVAAAEAEIVRIQPRVEMQERVEHDLAEARRNADRLADLQKNLEQGRRRQSDLAARLSKVQEGLAELTDVEEKIVSRQIELRTWDDQRDMLTSQISGRETELTQLRDQAKREAKRLADAKKNVDGELARLAELEARLIKVQAGLDESIRVRQQVRVLQTDLEVLDKRYRELLSQSATYWAERDQVKAQITVLKTSKAPQCPVCNGPLTPTHRAELLTQYGDRHSGLEVKLEHVRSQQEETKTTRDQTRQALRDLEQKALELPRPSEADSLQAQVNAQRQMVSQSEAALEVERTDIDANQSRQIEVEQALGDLKVQQKEAETARHQVQQALDQLEKRRKKLPRAEEAGELSAQIEAERESVRQVEASVTGLTGAPAEVERLAAELETLGDPRRDYQRAAVTADRRSAVERDLAATENRITGLNGQIEAINRDLAPYADLDGRIAAEQATMSAHEADQRRYLEHVREAEGSASRQQQATALAGELQAAQAERDRLTGERDRCAAEYDAETYTNLSEQHSALSSQVATLMERVRLQRDQLEEALAEIKRLIGVQGQLGATRAEHVELVEVQILLGHLRQVLRDAGPKVTKALVDVISLQAARLYADIMADHTARLQWTEDYEILLTTSGRERSFQQLSGGEQMAAALAMRLALLREVSAIDIAFFDEPTANLDDHRRDNLAEQLLNIKARFSQLFVISHDDTFERDTDHVVRVIKESGVSQVEA